MSRGHRGVLVVAALAAPVAEDTIGRAAMSWRTGGVPAYAEADVGRADDEVGDWRLAEVVGQNGQRV